MESKIEISDKDKYEVLKTLLIENEKDLIFWRERSWKFTSWLIGGFVALSGLSFFVKNAYALSFVIGGLAIFGTIYLVKNYNTYSNRLKYRVRIETALRFFECGAYIVNETLLPPEYKNSHPTVKGSGTFIAMIWIIAIATIITTILGGM